MILFDSSYEEIYRQMSEEKEKVHYYVEKNHGKAMKKFKNGSLPNEFHLLQTMPATKNTYLHYYYVMTPAEVRDECCFHGSLLLVNGEDGKQFAIRLTKQRCMVFGHKVLDLEMLHIFTGHFLSRYRQRFSYFKDISTHELIASFAGRNLGYLCTLDYDKVITENKRYENGAAWAIDDGMILGQTLPMVIDGKTVFVCIHKTFIGRQLMTDNQTLVVPNRDILRNNVTMNL